MELKEIKSKSFKGMVFLVAVMGLGIFLPAWSIDFTEGWVFMIVFFSCVLFTTIYFIKKDPKLLENRLYAGPIAERGITQKIIQSINATLFISMLVIPGFDHRYHWSSLPFYVVIISNVLIITGFWIVFLVLRDNSYASNIIKVDEGQKVISTGTYSVVRHPMYSGGLLVWLFFPLALGSYWAFAIGLFAFVMIIVRLIDEEKYLKKNLQGYNEYCEKTRFRLIPGIW